MQFNKSCTAVQPFNGSEPNHPVSNKKKNNEQSGLVGNLKGKIDAGWNSNESKLFEISVVDQSAEITQKLPNEVLKVAFGHLGYQDVVAVSLTSKYWTDEMTNFKEALLLKSFLAVVAEKFGQEKDKLLEVAENIDFSKAKDLPDLENMLLDVRLKVIDILSDRYIMDAWSFTLIKKPKLFDGLFVLADTFRKFRSEMRRSYGGHPEIAVASFCELEALDVALHCLEIIWDAEKKRLNDPYYLMFKDFLRNEKESAYCKSLKCVAKPLLKIDNFNKLGELTNTRADESTKKAIVEMCMELGKIDEGYALAEMLEIQITEDYHGLKPIIQMIKERKFKEAAELQNSMNKNLSQLVDRFVREGLEQACSNLFQEAKFEEVKKLVELSGINLSHDAVQNIYMKLAIGLVKWDRFDEAVECAKLLEKDSPYLNKVFYALCKKARFNEAETINDDGLFGQVRLRSIKLYKILHFSDLDEAMSKIKNSYQDSLMIYFIRKLLDEGKIDNALDVAERVSEPVNQLKLLKIFSEYNSR